MCAAPSDEIYSWEYAQNHFCLKEDEKESEFSFSCLSRLVFVHFLVMLSFNSFDCVIHPILCQRRSFRSYIFVMQQHKHTKPIQVMPSNREAEGGREEQNVSWQRNRNKKFSFSHIWDENCMFCDHKRKLDDGKRDKIKQMYQIYKYFSFFSASSYCYARFHHFLPLFCAFFIHNRKKIVCFFSCDSHIMNKS